LFNFKAQITSEQLRFMNNRRNFIRNIAFTSLAATISPQLIQAATLQEPHNFNGGKRKTILFQGDSITDGGRSHDKDWNHIYGQCYSYLIISKMNFENPTADYHFLNRGISGDNIMNLSARWDKDTLALKPDVLSILVGINDVDNSLSKKIKFTADDYLLNYDLLLQRTVMALPQTKLVLCEPFILPVGMVKNDPDLWHREVKLRQEIVKKLALKYDATFIPFQSAFDQAVLKAPAAHWIWDGIHPMPAGHELMAREWIKRVRL
jgi:lysophospholipase L1-like esterase